MANENMKAQFVQLLKDTQRPGVDSLLAWLETTDFYKAPCSTCHHLAHEGGLLEHFLNVYNRLLARAEGWDRSTIAVVALLHDLAKVDFYKKTFRSQKNKKGQWEKVPSWTYEDQFPAGHGEKSVILIMRHLDLTDEEIMAINWHMGGFDNRVKGGSYSLNDAWSKYPLAVHLHLADMEATWLDERGTDA